MKKQLTKVIAVVMLAVFTVTFSGCFGSFSVTRNLWEWNSNVSNNKFVNELVFLGLCIVPAYELFTLGDVLIFNSIEFWSGRNPIAMNPGEVEEETMAYAGSTYTISKSHNKAVISNETTYASREFQYFPEEEAWYLMNGDEKVAMMKNSKKMFKAVEATN